MKDLKTLIALSLSIPAISLSMFGCVYVLHMFWVMGADDGGGDFGVRE